MKPLPYATDALAPAISEETIRYHYGKHYRGYVERLNELVADTPFANRPLEEIICEADGPLYNQAAQVWNHEFYFDGLTPTPQPHPTGALLEAINLSFGSFDGMKEQMTRAALSLFGSGWVWLVEEPSGDLKIISEPNAGNPLRYGMNPLLVIDVWEHAYYIDYRNARAQALNQLWPLINWREVEARYIAEPGI